MRPDRSRCCQPTCHQAKAEVEGARKWRDPGNQVPCASLYTVLSHSDWLWRATQLKAIIHHFILLQSQEQCSSTRTALRHRSPQWRWLPSRYADLNSSNTHPLLRIWHLQTTTSAPRWTRSSLSPFWQWWWCHCCCGVLSEGPRHWRLLQRKNLFAPWPLHWTDSFCLRPWFHKLLLTH